MYEMNTVAGGGLKKIFLGQLILVLSIPLSHIPLLGTACMIAGYVLSVIGLGAAAPAHQNYKYALYVVVAQILLSLLGTFGDGIIGSLLGIAASGLALLNVYLVCTASAALLCASGNQTQARRGDLIWRLYAFCAVVAVLCGILSVIPIIGALAGPVGLVEGLISFVAGVLYLLFLYNASKALH